MPNITIYLPDTVAGTARRLAKKDRLTMSKWVASVIARHVRSGPKPGVMNAAGAIPDFPDLSELRGGYGRDAERENL